MNNEDSKIILDETLKDLESNKSVIFFISSNGNISMISTGDISPKQKKICERILVSCGDHSIILSIFLYLEILFEKFVFKIKDIVNSKSNY